MSKKVKIFAIVVIVIAIVVGAFSYFGNSAPAASTTGLSSSAASSAGAGLPSGGTGEPATATAGQFSGAISTISTITLDTSLFSNPAYLALRDFPITLGTAIIGRQNPFAPIGLDSNASLTAPVLQIQTLAPGKIISTSAELGALVTVNNTAPVSVVFKYGTSDTFGTDSTPITVSKSGTALFTASGLVPATMYYVEAVAVQGSNTATGTIMTFTTSAATQSKR